MASRAGTSEEVRGRLDVLSERGRLPRPGHLGHLPRSSIREGRAVLHHHVRLGRIPEDAPGDDRHRRRVRALVRLSLPSRQHRLGRTEQRGHQKIRSRSLVPLPAAVPRARELLELHRLPEPRHGDPLRRQETGRQGEEVRAHAQLHALRLRPHDLLSPGERADRHRRSRARRPAALHSGQLELPAVRPRRGRQALRSPGC
mmetsp:Transcript_5317/g.16722  ORF Transcript_5317/g.16722 Transcript_5317/m.16722 type:complete len:201 (+) Transcript_5317:791-1393(+)